MTTRDLITTALQRINVINAGEAPSADDVNDALDRLNDLIDSWATERLTIYSTVRTTWSLVSGQASYSIGSGGDCNIARPVFIEDLNFIDTSQTPPLEMNLSPLTTDAYALIPQKALTSVYPTCYYYNATYPTGTVTMWPVPTSSVLQGVIYAPTAVTELGLNDTISLPPGYRRFLRDNLAIEIATEYDVKADPELVRIARESKEQIKRANIRLYDLSMDPALRARQGRYNIFSDTGA